MIFFLFLYCDREKILNYVVCDKYQISVIIYFIILYDYLVSYTRSVFFVISLESMGNNSEK